MSRGWFRSLSFQSSDVALWFCRIVEFGSPAPYSGDPFSLQVSVGCASLDAGADVLTFRVLVRSTLNCRYQSDLQLLMSLMATMMAMTTMRMTRMIRR